MLHAHRIEQATACGSQTEGDSISGQRIQAQARVGCPHVGVQTYMGAPHPLQCIRGLYKLLCSLCSPCKLYIIHVVLIFGQ